MNILSAWTEMVHSFPHAIWAGLTLAVCCSFLGTFVVLKRLVFIGATLSQTATCGIAAALFFHIHPFLGAVALNIMAVTLLAFSAEEVRVPRDAVMAALFILTSSLGVLFVSKSSNGLEEVQSLLYGDLLITSAQDLKILLIVLVPLTLTVLLFFRPILYTFVDREEAKVLGIQVRFWELLFYYILGIVVSAASKLGGMVLVFCLLVIPPMTGLLASNRLKGVICISIVSAILSIVLGFYFSYLYDFPTNQVIAVTTFLWLALVFVQRGLSFLIKK